MGSPQSKNVSNLEEAYYGYANTPLQPNVTTTGSYQTMEHNPPQPQYSNGYSSNPSFIHAVTGNPDVSTTTSPSLYPRFYEKIVPQNYNDARLQHCCHCNHSPYPYPVPVPIVSPQPIWNNYPRDLQNFNINLDNRYVGPRVSMQNNNLAFLTPPSPFNLPQFEPLGLNFINAEQPPVDFNLQYGLPHHVYGWNNYNAQLGDPMPMWDQLPLGLPHENYHYGLNLDTTPYHHPILPHRQPILRRQIIRVPGGPGQVRQVVRRAPTPQPDIIERVYVVKPNRDVLNVIIERPTTPMPQVKTRKIMTNPPQPPLVQTQVRRVPPRGLGL